MDDSVGTIRLKKVVNTEETTTITVQVYISETDLPQGRKPSARKYKRTLVLQRARYPQRRKQDGKLFTERECPSCGANFAPVTVFRLTTQNGWCRRAGHKRSAMFRKKD